MSKTQIQPQQPKKKIIFFLITSVILIVIILLAAFFFQTQTQSIQQIVNSTSSSNPDTSNSDEASTTPNSNQLNSNSNQDSIPSEFSPLNITRDNIGNTSIALNQEPIPEIQNPSKAVLDLFEENIYFSTQEVNPSNNSNLESNNNNDNKIIQQPQITLNTQIKKYNIQTKQIETIIDLNPYYPLPFKANNDYLIYTQSNNEVYIYNLQTKEKTKTDIDNKYPIQDFQVYNILDISETDAIIQTIKKESSAENINQEPIVKNYRLDILSGEVVEV